MSSSATSPLGCPWTWFCPQAEGEGLWSSVVWEQDAKRLAQGHTQTGGDGAAPAPRALLCPCTWDSTGNPVCGCRLACWACCLMGIPSWTASNPWHHHQTHPVAWRDSLCPGRSEPRSPSRLPIRQRGLQSPRNGSGSCCRPQGGGCGPCRAQCNRMLLPRVCLYSTCPALLVYQH